MAWHVVIAGGGFGGFYAARTLERSMPPASARITLVSDVNFMLYTPLLPGAAAGTLEPRHVVVPLREALDRTDLRIGTVARRRPGPEDRARAVDRGPRRGALLRPPDRRRRLRLAHAAGPGARGARHRLQVAARCDRAAQPRPAHARGGRDARGPRRARGVADLRVRRRGLRRARGPGRAGRTSSPTRWSATRAVRTQGVRWILVEATERVMPEISADLAEFAVRELRGRGHRDPHGDDAREPDRHGGDAQRRRRRSRRGRASGPPACARIPSSRSSACR